MSNSNRSPHRSESKKGSTEKSKTEERTIIETTWKRIEKSEIEKLNSRLEEQINLVQYYKDRGEDHKRRICKLERINTDIIEKKERLAKEFDNLNNHNKLLDMDIEKLNGKNDKLQDIISHKELELTSLGDEKQNLKLIIDQLTEKYDEYKIYNEKKISNLSEECKHSKEWIKEILTKNKETLESLQQKHEERIKELNAIISDIKLKNVTKLDDSNLKIEELKAKMIELNTECSIKTNKISKLSQDLNKKENIIHVLQTEIDEINFKVSDFSTKLTDKTNENISLHNDLSDRAKDISLLINDRSDKNYEIDRLNSNIHHKQNEIVSLKFKINDLETKIKELNILLNEQKSEAESTIKRLTNSFKQMNKEKDEISLECKRLNADKSISLEKCLSFQEMIQELYGETIKLKENPVNKKLEFDLSESSKRYEDLFEEFIYYKSVVKNSRGKSSGTRLSAQNRATSPAKISNK